NEGVVPLIEMRFPEKGTLLTPIFPAPTNARTFVILRLLGVLAGVLAKATGGRMPADQETIRYTGVYGTDLDGQPYLMREVLGGGRAGKPFQITVDPGGPAEHDVDALADAEPLTAGTVVRIRTTGGGGWGDPLERPVEEVLRDLAWRKVSVPGARDDYGVVVRDD